MLSLISSSSSSSSGLPITNVPGGISANFIPIEFVINGPTGLTPASSKLRKSLLHRVPAPARQSIESAHAASAATRCADRLALPASPRRPVQERAVGRVQYGLQEGFFVGHRASVGGLTVFGTRSARRVDCKRFAVNHANSRGLLHKLTDAVLSQLACAGSLSEAALSGFRNCIDRQIDRNPIPVALPQTFWLSR